MGTPPRLVAVTPMQTTMLTVMLMMVVLMSVRKMDAGAVNHTMRLGASLRDRATLPSPLRGLGPSGGYPSRLRSLRSLRAPLARRLATAHRRVPVRRLGALDGRLGFATATFSSRRRFARRSSRCRLRRAPGGARPDAPLAALVRALLRSAPALRCAPRRAPVPTPLRSPPPSPAAACCARLPAAPGAPPATQSPWRLPSAGFTGVDSPNLDAAGLAVPTARGGLGSHTPRSALRVCAFGAYGVPCRALAPPAGAALLLERAVAPRYTPFLTVPRSRGRAWRSPLHARSTSPMPRSTIHERRSHPPSVHIAADPGAQSPTLNASKSLR